MKLSQKSLTRLSGLHPDLVKVVKRAVEISDMDFTVLEGLRSVERQRELVKKGASKTMNSRHLTGHAVDLAPLTNGSVTWDWPQYYKLEKIVKRAAKDVNVTIEWGGDWKTFKDGPHWQLPFSKYPKTQTFVAEVDTAPKYTAETDTQAHTKAVASAAGGAASGVVVGYEPLIKGVEVLTQQQDELSSGDWIRIGVAVILVAAAAWFAWKKLK